MLLLCFSSQNRAYRHFLEKTAFSTPLCGGDHGRAQKVKKYNKNIPENHNKKLQVAQVPEILENEGRALEILKKSLIVAYFPPKTTKK